MLARRRAALLGQERRHLHPGEPGGGGNPRDVHAIRAGGGVLHGGLYVRAPGERAELPDSDAGLEQKPRERPQELERRRADCGLDVPAHCQARVRSRGST